MTTTTTVFSWTRPSVGDDGPGWATQYNACLEEIDASVGVEHDADGTHGAITPTSVTSTGDIATAANKDFKKGTVAGDIFVPADKDADGDFDALVSDSSTWELKTIASGGTGTINWNAVFGVPATAGSVVVSVNAIDAAAIPIQAGVFQLKAKSTTTNYSLVAHISKANADDIGRGIVYAQGIVPIGSGGTSYYYAESRDGVGAISVTVRVLGYFL